MSKKNKTPLGIFIESIGLYFSNFDKFVKYMTFPVLGQVGGLILTFLLTFFYAKNLPNLVLKFETLNNPTILILCAILITLPGLIIFTKSFWEYLVAYGAINSMLENMLKSGKVYDFEAHTELIKRRTIPFIGLWFLFGIFSLIGSFPLFWVIYAVFMIYFVLVFQVFTFEPEQNPMGCVKRSLLLIKGHFASTFMLFALIGALTYIFIPDIANRLFSLTKITPFISNLINPFTSLFDLKILNNLLTTYNLKPITTEMISTFFVTTTTTQIFIQYTLPMRSILWSMWYKELGGNTGFVQEKKSKKSSKKPSEKLMEVSHKKYTTKKLDRNILKRAMEKED